MLRDKKSAKRTCTVFLNVFASTSGEKPSMLREKSQPSRQLFICIFSFYVCVCVCACVRVCVCACVYTHHDFHSDLMQSDSHRNHPRVCSHSHVSLRFYVHQAEEFPDYLCFCEAKSNSERVLECLRGIVEMLCLTSLVHGFMCTAGGRGGDGKGPEEKAAAAAGRNQGQETAKGGGHRAREQESEGLAGCENIEMASGRCAWIDTRQRQRERAYVMRDSRCSRNGVSGKDYQNRIRASDT
jgi:hypothetical protein